MTSMAQFPIVLCTGYQHPSDRLNGQGDDVQDDKPNPKEFRGDVEESVASLFNTTLYQ